MPCKAAGLVTVSRKGGRWSAALTPAGLFYLDHGHHPPDVEKVPKRKPGSRARISAKPAERPAEKAHRRVEGRSAERPAVVTAAAKPVPTAGPSLWPRRFGPAEQLVVALIDAGCVLRIPRPDGRADAVDYPKLIRSASRRGIIPAGKRVITRELAGSEMEICLVDAVPGNDPPRRPVPVPARVVQFHPVVAAFQRSGHRHHISEDHLNRAMLILHALTVEAERRGYHVALVPEPDSRHAQRWVGRHGGQLSITIGEHTQPLKILEVVTPAATSPPDTGQPHESDPPTGRLRIELTGYSNDGQVSRWSDTQRTPLDNRLPNVLAEIEIRCAHDAHREKERQDQDQEQRRLTELAVAEATARHQHTHRVQHLQDQMERWELVTRGQAFVAAARDQIAARRLAADPTTSGGDDIEADERWLSWAEEYLTNIDPLRASLAAPPPTKATAETI